MEMEILNLPLGETCEWYLPTETLNFWMCLDANQILLAKEKASCEVTQNP